MNPFEKVTLLYFLTLFGSSAFAQVPAELDQPILSTYSKYLAKSESHSRETHKLRSNVKQIVQSEKGTYPQRKHTYTYAKTGELTYYEVSELDNQEWSRIISKSYLHDANGQLTKMIRCDYNGTVATDIYVYNYNKDGFLIEAYDSLAPKTSRNQQKMDHIGLATRLTYSYTLDSGEVKMTKTPKSEFDIRGYSQAYSFAAKFDSNQRLVHLKVDNEFDDETYTAKYSKNNQSISYRSQAGNRSMSSQISRNIANGTVHRKSVSQGIDHIGYYTATNETLIEINDKGLITCIRRRVKQDYGGFPALLAPTLEDSLEKQTELPIVSKYSYQYDSLNNWTVRSCFDESGKLEKTVNRIITYY